MNRLPALAADLVSRKVAVIVSAGHVLGAIAAKKATSTIPILFVSGSDPVALGLVASLNHPGGNLTGVSTLGVELERKRLELLHHVVPRARTVAALIRSANPAAEQQEKELLAAAAVFGLNLQIVDAENERDFDVVFAKIAELKAGGLVIATDGFFISLSERLAALTVRDALPAVSVFRPFAAAGGLMSYGGDLSDLSRQIGIYAGRILKGEKPAELPVVQSTKVELVINLKSAKALGVEIPPTLLARAIGAATAALASPVAAQTGDAVPVKDTAVSPGVVLREYGQERSIIPGFGTVKLRDIIVQPGATTKENNEMMNAMVCHVTEGELEVVQDGKTIPAKKNYVWSCNKGTKEHVINKGNVVAVMRIIDLIA